MNVSAATLFRTLKNNSLFAALFFFISSCSVVKDYPANTPFIYETNIQLAGKFSMVERKELTNKLNQQLHDSIRPRRVQRLVGWENGPRFFYSVLRKPPVYDSSNADKSIIYLQALLNSLGYYRDSITYDTSLQIEQDQYRTVLNFKVDAGKLIQLDSVSFTVGHDTLQKITNVALRESLLKKGQPFAKPLISSELDRLTDVYRNNGYLRFSRDELVAVWDTVGLALIRPTIDPFEQAQQFEALRRRREAPTADVEVRLRDNKDTSHLVRYYVGNVVIYPDLSADTSLYIPTSTFIKGYEIVAYKALYKPKVLAESMHLRRGDLYSQRNYLKTLNRFNSLGSWRLVAIDGIPRTLSDTVDFSVKLTPHRKYLIDYNLQVSQNWGSILTQGNLIGINVGLQNRNFGRGANIANTNFSAGTEVTRGDIARTKQLTIGHTIIFPRAIPALKWIPSPLKENFKTIFAFNLNYTNRLDYYNLTTINSSWGYEFSWKNKLLTIRLPNIEYALLDRGPLLIQLIDSNRSYRYIFNDGIVSSIITNFTVTGGRKKTANVARFNVEAAGLLTGLFRSKFLDENLFRFVKLDADFRQTRSLGRNAFAWRLFGGAGYELPSKHNLNNQYLPFFKQYFAGGANSMRAWQLRRLGPGSAIKSFDRNKYPDRFGDIQLEANAEYRFYLTSIGSFKINSVLFTDVGNIWFMRKNPDFPDGEFRFSKLWKDVAVGAGTGIRGDFGLFLLRLDYAYKVKDPSPETIELQNKILPDWKINSGQFQLGVTYPF